MGEESKGKDGYSAPRGPSPAEPLQPKVPYKPGPVISKPDDVMKIIGPTPPKQGQKER